MGLSLVVRSSCLAPIFSVQVSVSPLTPGGVHFFDSIQGGAVRARQYYCSAACMI